MWPVTAWPALSRIRDGEIPRRPSRPNSSTPCWISAAAFDELPKHTAKRSARGRPASPASSYAMRAAATPKRAKRPMVAAVLADMNSRGSKSRTSAATRHEKGAGSNSVMGPIPPTPSRSACQNGLTPVPTGVTAPSPVMTTRRISLPVLVGPRPPDAPPAGPSLARREAAGSLPEDILSARRPLVGQPLDQGHDVPDRPQLRHLLVAHAHVELPLGRDGQLD